MTTPAVWASDHSGEWELLNPSGFPAEAALHDLVEANPALLPLSGSPQLAVLGREVALVPGSADLLAVEPTGRLAVIEVKLAQNPEARRAIIAQVLAYAAFLKGMSFETLAARVDPYLSRKNMGAVGEGLAGFTSDVATFRSGVEDSLATGRFRLVLVLDSAPSDLVRLVGYLEEIGDHLVVDLIQVTAYEVGDHRVLVPQRVDPERSEEPDQRPARTERSQQGELDRTPALFGSSLEGLAEPAANTARRLREWAGRLADAGVARLESYRGPSYTTLLVRLADEDVGLVTVFNDGQRVSVGLYRQVFERRAPDVLPRIEELIGRPVGRGSTVYEVSDALLDVLEEAYRVATSGSRQVPCLTGEVPDDGDGWPSARP